MLQLHAHADTSGEGLLDFDEFTVVLQDPQVRTWLAAQEINTSDADVLFKLLDEDKTGEITAEQLVTGMTRIKGSARSIDLLVLQREIRDFAEAMGVKLSTGYVGAPDLTSDESSK